LTNSPTTSGTPSPKETPTLDNRFVTCNRFFGGLSVCRNRSGTWAGAIDDLANSPVVMSNSERNTAPQIRLDCVKWPALNTGSIPVSATMLS
jgi:hypothetical protein